MTLLTLTGVGHVYDAGTPWEHRALSDVDLAVEAGEAIAVHGHNGSGKSTLFRIVTGVLRPTEGDARLDGRPLTDHRELVGACLQQARLQLFGATVDDDLSLDPAVPPAAQVSALQRVGLDPLVDGPRRVDELSGGQQRLLAIAGALVRRPRLLVLDEPFAGIDPDNAERILLALAHARDDGIATMVLTPDPDEAQASGRVVEIAAGRVVRP
ncbi:MAG TPA: ABC transporter ATP-binding protein [Mycobacteriales bacterium]|jgi:energy-coupling factor transport system ATP-binding protein|nr:ABC transporter ATP-binding protein [Mycobacteriales bacterium]